VIPRALVGPVSGTSAVAPAGHLPVAAGAVPDGLVERLHRHVVEAETQEWAALAPAQRRRRLAALARTTCPLLGDEGVDAAVARALDRVAGLGPLEPLLGDPEVTEVMVNGGGTVWVERAGRLERCAGTIDEPAVLHLIERILAPLGRRVDRSSPLVDGRLPDGSRVHAVIPPVAVDGPCLTIRRFGVAAVPLHRFGPPEVVGMLARAVAERRNILISGGTGAGKTTLLNALAGVIPADERIVTIEDTAELRLTGPHVVRLEARPANGEGVGELRIGDLVRNALRMRPDRLIVGEVRGGEALDMVLAMNTGHDGSLSTCHANSPDDALRRMETMALMAPVELPLAAVREQVRSSLDLVVQVSRGPGGARTVHSVDEVESDASDRGFEWSSNPGGPVRGRPVVRDGQLVDGFRRPPRTPEPAPTLISAPDTGRSAA
jgi:pilus assembly protein CpaF